MRDRCGKEKGIEKWNEEDKEQRSVAWINCFYAASSRPENKLRDHANSIFREDQTNQSIPKEINHSPTPELSIGLIKVEMHGAQRPRACKRKEAGIESRSSTSFLP